MIFIKKYIIDYGYGIATLYTPYPNPDVRFLVLINSCFDISRSVLRVKVCSVEYADDVVEWVEKLEIDEHVYIWDSKGGRKIIKPVRDTEWDYSRKDQIRYVKEGI